MSSATKVAHKNDSDDIADFVGARNEAREAGRDFESLLDRRNHRIYVTWAKCLLQRDQKWQKEHEHLKQNE